MTDPNRGDDLLGDAKEEIVGMAKQGMKHPSTGPVLTGAAIGGVAGLLLPVLSIPVGALLGAGFTLYKRLRP
ncbi:hypothetical protein [Novosphingobium sp.]|uniref:hypothetical protein n=1 Tax=Novosphingobium sp. TaxID=1874826 RepID=UPI0035B0A5BC